MRLPEKFPMYSYTDNGVLIPRTGYTIFHLVEQAPIGLPYLARLNFGTYMRYVYVPKFLKIYNKTFSVNASKIKEFMGNANFVISQVPSSLRTSFIYDLTPYLAFLKTRLAPLSYANYTLEILTDLVSSLKSSIPTENKTILLYTIDETLLQKNMTEKDFLGYFLTRAMINNDKEIGGLPFDMAFMNVMSSRTSIYRKFYSSEVPASFSRFRTMMLSIKPDLETDHDDSTKDETTKSENEVDNEIKKKQETELKFAEKEVEKLNNVIPKRNEELHVTSKNQETIIQSSDDEEDQPNKKEVNVTSSEINPDSELNHDFLTSKTTKIVKSVDTQKLMTISKSIAQRVSQMNKSYSPEVIEKIERQTYNFLSRRPQEALEAEKLFDDRDFDKLSVYVGNATEQYESQIYPKKPEVKKEVLDQLDEWSNRHGFDRVSSIDAALNSDVVSKVFECNLHRVMAQKQLTWESMPEELEKVCYKVLEDAGFRLLGISIIDKEPDPKQIEPTYMSQIKLKIKNLKTKRIQTLNFLIPTLLEGKYHISGGIKWLSPNVLATLPIFVIAPGKVQFKTNYSASTFQHVINSKKDSVVVLIGGMKINILTLFLQFKSWAELCKEFDITYRIINAKKELEDDETLIKLPDDRLMAVKPSKDMGKKKSSLALITDLSGIVKKINHIDLNTPDTDSKILEDIVQRKNAGYVMKKIKRYMIDARTSEILQSRGIEPNLYMVSKRCMDLAINDVTEDKLGIDNTIIRLMDIIPAEVERALHYGVTEWRRRSAIEPDANLQVNEGWIINSLRENAVHMLYKDGNPTIETAQFTAVRLVGPGGFSKVDSIQVKDRRIPPTHFGVIDPVDTAEGNPGTQLYLTTGFEYDPKNKVFQHVGYSDNYHHTFSAGASQIPFINCDDGNRVQYGSSQMRQAVPILNSEVPIVATGIEGIMTNYLSNKFTKRARKDGRVDYIDKNVIILTYDDMTKEKIDITPSALQTGVGKHNGLIHTPVVQVGDKVKAWQHLVKNQFVNQSFSGGCNVLAAYKPEQGYSFEDGIVVSESFAKKYTSIHYENIDVFVDSLSEIKSFPLDKLKEGLPLEYEAGEPIIKLSTESLGGFQENTVIAPTKCKISDIKIYPAKDDFVPLAKEVDTMFYGETNEMLRKYGLAPVTNINDIVSNIGKFQFRKDLLTRTLIRISVLEYRSIGLGDKLNNRHGNKGVVTKILPDDQMPRLKDGRHLDVLFNPLGVISRMNIGQLYEIHCGNILAAARKRLDVLSLEESRSMLCTLYTLLDGYEDKRLSKMLVQNLRSLSQPQMGSLLNDLKQNGVHMIFPPYKIPSIDDIEKAADLVKTELYSKLYIPTYDRYTAYPVTWGVLYVNKLEHISAIKQNVRSVGPYIKTTLQPGKPGNHRNAVRIGEFDAWAFLAYDASDVLKDMFLVNGDNPKLKNKVIYDIETKGSASITDLDIKEATEGGSVQSFEVFMTVAGLKV